MTVKKNITLAPVHLKLKTPAEADEMAMKLLARIGLEDKANEYLSKIVTDINHFERDENVLEQVRLELGYALEEAMAEGK